MIATCLALLQLSPICCFEKLENGFQFQVNSHTLTSVMNSALKLTLPFLDGKCQDIDYNLQKKVGKYDVELKVGKLCLEEIQVGQITKDIFVKEDPESEYYFFSLRI